MTVRTPYQETGVSVSRSQEQIRKHLRAAGAQGVQFSEEWSDPHWDDRRNTSQTRHPDPRALDACLRACAALRLSDPALVKWIEDGHPNLTVEEHRARFGHDYEKGRR